MFRYIVLIISGLFLISRSVRMLIVEEKQKRIECFAEAVLAGIVLYYIWFT